MKSNMMSVVSAFLFFHLLSIATVDIGFCNGRSTYVGGCIESERRALLTFKQDLNDSSNRLASWIGDGDCCNWAGVVCDNFTSHVIQLRLGNPHLEFFTSDYRSYAEYEAYTRSQLGGKINPSLLDLKLLIHLDLSFNDFHGIQIPRFLGSMQNLRYLNLSHAEFHGMIPQQLGNLSNLQYLDLGSNFELYVENSMWISGLSLLKHLGLSGLNLNKNSDHWLLKISSLPFLEVLHLSDCQLPHSPQIPAVNFSSLTTLDLSYNEFDNSLIPNWVFGLSRLVFLDLRSNQFEGPIVDGLGNLTSLRHLDLSSNGFNDSIPNWLSRFSHLEYLSLFDNNLQGSFSNAIGNLTSIKTLDLSFNYNLEGRIPTSFGRLCNLRSISMSFTNLNSSISEVLDIFSGCVSATLESLDLMSCQLSGHLTDQLGRFKNLETLYLSNNSISGPIPSSIGELSSLVTLDLSENSISGPIPSSIGELSSLGTLDLSGNSISGPIPSSIGELSSLGTLDLSGNSISGPIPSSIGELSSLDTLDLSNNKLNGTLSQIHFSNLTRLLDFEASNNSQIVVKISSDWVPPFQLRSFRLRSCHLGPHFPLWLHSQKSLNELDISNNGISDVIPDWFWKSLSQLSLLNLSHNQIHQNIPNFTNTGGFSTLDLSSNKFFGPLPPISFAERSFWILDLSNNALSGSIFQFLCYGMNESKTEGFLNLENNSLSGELPDCWMNWQNLRVLNLGNNKFTGNLPTSMGNLSFLWSLILRKNNFSGVIPLVSLENCTQLQAFDAAENQLVGNVPTWKGERFPWLKLLILRSNKLHGVLPMQLCQLSSLQILDLAYNNLSGNIPRCINNFTAMVNVDHLGSTAIRYIWGLNMDESALLVWKGTKYEYSAILNLLRVIDLSKNNFSGEIPREVTSLVGLQSLNLSHNSFSGRIPQKIGAMGEIQSIDFSTNQLSGEIPPSISSLTFLSLLNLSNNKLSGKIPLSTQIQSLEASSFTGNDLCGPPLPNCKENVITPEHEIGGKDGNEHGVDWFWFYVSIALGFVVGFWGFIGPLLINRKWRYTYCGFLDRLGDKIYFVTRKCF